MRTKKPKSVAPEAHSKPAPKAPETGEETPPIAPVSNADRNEEKPLRISFNLTGTGTPDWERMLPKTKEQLEEILRNPNVQKELGFTKEQAKAIEAIGFGEDEANALLDLLGGIDSIAASKIYGVSPEITSQAFAFTPDHRKKVNPVLTRLMNKWGPSILKTWKDEIGAGILLFAIINSQVRLMHVMEEKRRKNLPAPAPAPVSKVTSISQAPAQTETPKPEAPKPEAPPAAVANSSDPLENVGFSL